MPAFRVAIDDIPLVTISTDGFDVINVRAAGTRIDDDDANLDLSGGSYPENGNSTYLTWLNDLPLQEGKVVTVTFLEAGVTSFPGKTIKELFPGEPLPAQVDIRPESEIFEQLRAMPTLHDGFCFHVLCASGASFTGETRADEHGFAFSVLWNSHHPERARASLHSYTLKDVETRATTDDHFLKILHFGEWVQFEVSAKRSTQWAHCAN